MGAMCWAPVRVSIAVSQGSASQIRRYEAFQGLSCYQPVLSTALCRHLLMAHTIRRSVYMRSVSSLHRYRIRFRVVREMCFTQAEERVRGDLGLGGNAGRWRSWGWSLQRKKGPERSFTCSPTLFRVSPALKMMQSWWPWPYPTLSPRADGQPLLWWS